MAAGADRIKLIPTGIINFKKGAVTTEPQMTVEEIAQLGAARTSTDLLQRRRAERVLARYYPLLSLMRNPASLRPYLSLDGRFMTMIADLLPAKRLTLSGPIADCRL